MRGATARAIHLSDLTMLSHPFTPIIRFYPYMYQQPLDVHNSNRSMKGAKGTMRAKPQRPDPTTGCKVTSGTTTAVRLVGQTIVASNGEMRKWALLQDVLVPPWALLQYCTLVHRTPPSRGCAQMPNLGLTNSSLVFETESH